MSNEDFKETIIIRKRRDDGEGDHHGGVWKLAFADFMTAMMAFFLVMWLINSTSKETKAAIVQYFNPVQLIDANPARKGLRDPTDSGQGASAQQTEDKKESAGGAARQQSVETHEASLHKEPMLALDEIAERDPSPPPPRASRPPSATMADPFDRMEASAAPESAHEAPANEPRTQHESTPKREGRQPAAQALSNELGGAGHESPNLDAGAALQSAIAKAVRAESRGPQSILRFDVKRTDEGVMISLTDDANFSMFEIGSIEPKPQLVRILGQIGRALTKQAGEVEVAGHTDGRSYKSKSYDNWRLSADRANMVNYMLMRGGLPAGRVTRISGYADKRLKVQKDPLAAVNRRIEILLRGDRT